MCIQTVLVAWNKFWFLEFFTFGFGKTLNRISMCDERYDLWRDDWNAERVALQLIDPNDFGSKLFFVLFLPFFPLKWL